MDSIRHILDEELFAALDLKRQGMEGVARAVESRDYAAAYRAWSEYWARGAGRVSFTGEGELLMDREEAAASIEARRGEIIAAAERVLRHEIQGWGDVVIQHGPVVDFAANYGKSGIYGFHYWGWGKPLVWAYLLTGEEKYLAEFEALFNSWYEQRDLVKGEVADERGLFDPIWYELGLGVRNRVFLEFYALIGDREQGTGNREESKTLYPVPCSLFPTHERMLKTLLGAARWLYNEEARMYRGGNWQIMGSYGLTQIGAWMPEYLEAEKWVELGVKRLMEHSERDFFEDGCHSERCPSSYSLVAWRDHRNLARLLGGLERAKQVEKKVELMEGFLAGVTGPDGYLPGINDGSRARLPEAIAARTDGRRVSRSTASGFTVMSAGELWMLVNHGLSRGGGHSHLDALSFELHAFGTPLAIDSGIGRTYDDPNHLPWYVRSRAHNMVTVELEDLDRRAAEGKEIVWINGEDFSYLAATHCGYLPKFGVVHRRHLALVRDEYFFVYDRLEMREGDAKRKVEWNIHLTMEAEAGLVVERSDTTAWKEVREKGWASVKGIAGYQGDYAEIEWLRFEGEVNPSEAAMLGVALYPYRKGKGKQPSVGVKMVERRETTAHFVVEHERGVDHLVFGEEGLEVR